VELDKADDDFTEGKGKGISYEVVMTELRAKLNNVFELQK
jgi:hypothetical protein